jgi:hypothetical protein
MPPEMGHYRTQEAFSATDISYRYAHTMEVQHITFSVLKERRAFVHLHSNELIQQLIQLIGS